MRALLVALMLMFGSQAGAENQRVRFGGDILNVPTPEGLHLAPVSDAMVNISVVRMARIADS